MHLPVGFRTPPVGFRAAPVGVSTLSAGFRGALIGCLRPQFRLFELALDVFRWISDRGTSGRPGGAGWRR